MTQVASVARDGRALGVKIGALVSLLYVGGYLLFTLMDPLYRPLVPTILLIGGIAGVVPATIIGMITGWCIGTLVEHFEKYLSWRSALAIGSMVCTAFALPINVVFWPEVFFLSSADDETRWWYLFLLGIPSIIYIFVGSGMSIWLYNRQNHRAAKG